MMRLTDSPYHYCQVVTWAKTIAIEDSKDSIIPFIWEGLGVNFIR